MLRSCSFAPARLRLLIPVLKTGLLLAGVSLFALGCEEAVTEPGAAAATGSISLFVTDAPSEDFDEINITIEKIELLGNGKPVTIFNGRTTVNLKRLENFSDLFLVSDDVPAGVYSKIRLKVKAIELVDHGADPESIDVKPPAKGKIDLNPRGPFELRSGGHVAIEIDMDAERSIHIQQKGRHRDEYRFRPVIFVTIGEYSAPTKLVRVYGRMWDRAGDGPFLLCPAPESQPEIDQRTEFAASGGCVLVETDERTGIFDSNGDPAELDDLRLQEARTDSEGALDPASYDGEDGLVTVIGHFVFPSSATSSWGDDEHDFPVYSRMELLAAVIEEGADGTFLQLGGWVDPFEIDGDLIPFRPDSGQGVDHETWLDALLQDGTRIFDRAGTEHYIDDIETPAHGEVDGVFGSEEPGGAARYKTSLIVLDESPLELPDGLFPLPPVDAVVGSVDVGRREIELIRDGVAVTFDVPEVVEIFFAYESADGFVNRMGSFGELEPGMQVQLVALGRNDPRSVTVVSILSYSEPSGS